MTALFGFLTLLTALFAYILFVGVFRAYVLTQLWAWFIVPLGLEQIGLWHAWGLAMIIGMFTVKASDYKSDEKKDMTEKIGLFISPVITTLVVWGIGSIVHSMMG